MPATNKPAAKSTAWTCPACKAVNVTARCGCKPSIAAVIAISPAPKTETAQMCEMVW